ncbi:MAG: HAMP domain-containing histidine kinase, partial [Terrimicrobiaceae bacterium]|nr:HAMP domain-containing histidine kinase [Terrimicrobiaceae bacterium]
TQLGGLKPDLKPQNLRALVSESEKACGPAARRKGVTLRVSVNSEAEVMTDASKMQVVFRNLLTNAVKFTPSGGEVNVTARREGNYWITVVADSGVGMEPERAAALFSGDGSVQSTPGTASERGLGLGTEICREFVKTCGGTITAESQPGAGTKVFVALPAHA